MFPKKFLISSCQSDGGLHSLSLLKDNFILKEHIDTGNVRGVTEIGEKKYYVKNNSLYSYFDDNVKFEFVLPNYGHDIKYDNKLNVFWFAATPDRAVYKLSVDGVILGSILFDSKYWLNCISLHEDCLIIFLSSKRPFPDSKIVCYTRELDFLWEYNCNPKDEIHSPVLFKGFLYWCISNKNLVVKSDVANQLNEVINVVQNNNGYTRGLYIDDDFLVVGTSENRHSENCRCISNINKATVNIYKKDEIVFSKILSCKEIYDIC